MNAVTTTKERPIIMTGESGRAIRDGRKTQTRRVVKRGPIDGATSAADWGGLWRWGRQANWAGMELGDLTPCPYGKPGDRLWVRETWSLVKPQYDYEFPSYVDGFEEWEGPVPDQCPRDWTLVLRSPWNGYEDETVDERGFAWRSPMFMPRWASRLTLEITEVRVQRLHEISEEDAAAEGMERVVGDGGASGPGFKFDGLGFWDGYSRFDGAKTYHATWGGRGGICCCYAGEAEKLTPARCAYRHLWNKINVRKHPWASNPWVWAVTFKRVADDALPR